MDISFDLVDPDGSVIYTWVEPKPSRSEEIREVPYDGVYRLKCLFELRLPPQDVTIVAAAIHVNVWGKHFTTTRFARGWKECPPLPDGNVYIFKQEVIVS